MYAQCFGGFQGDTFGHLLSECFKFHYMSWLKLHKPEVKSHGRGAAGAVVAENRKLGKNCWRELNKAYGEIL